mmetsp:Transcript_117635/g.279299  ORF Transcript_117635/g.279299 Transcript_117635/m.279299 type:complete len:205 (+) Transcript_117635:1-615(+)
MDAKPRPPGRFQLEEAAKTMAAHAAPAPRPEGGKVFELRPAEEANCASPSSRTKEVVLEPAQLDSPGCGADFWRLPMGSRPKAKRQPFFTIEVSSNAVAVAGNDQELDAEGYSGAKAPEGDDAAAASAASSAIAASAAASATASAAAASAAAAAAEATAAAVAGEVAHTEAAEEAEPTGGGIDFWRLPMCSGSTLEELSDDSTT